MTNETPRQATTPANARPHSPGSSAARATGAATQATRVAMAHRTAAQLASKLLLTRVRTRAARGWESALCPAMPQSGWLDATEHGLMTWLDAGGFAAGELPPAGVGAQTKTAA